MGSNSVDSCVNFLKAKSINVQREWCEACIEWIVEEHNGEPSYAQLTNLVYEQWLMADLREIATPSFPQGISGKKGVHTYQGKICVQVDQTLDISRSAYSQLSKIKGTEVDDIDADDDELKQFFKEKNATKGAKGSENKWKKDVSSRMLMLQLHDGHQGVDAIEYRPIKQLDVEDPLPGGKVMLIGPYTARDGLLFLEEHNIKLLGGNVEDLVEKSSQLKILAGILDVDVTANQQQQAAPNAQNGTTTATSSNKTNTNQTTAVASNNKNDNDNNANLIDDDFFINDIFDDIEVDGIDDLALSQMPVDDNPPPNNSRKASTNPKPVPNKKKNNNRLSSTIKSNVSGIVKKEEFINYDSPGLGGLGVEVFSEDISIVGDTPVNEAKMTKKTTDNSKGKVKSENCKLASRAEFESDCKTSITEVKEEEEDDADDHQCRENPKQTLVNGKAGKETSLSEVIANDEPMRGVISLKASFTTLTSKLVFEPCYHLTAIITDGDEFFEVTLGEALEGLVGHTAEEIQEAVSGMVSRTERKMMSAAIKKAEKALEEESWHLKMEFNEKENIYCVVSMLPAAK